MCLCEQCLLGTLLPLKSLEPDVMTAQTTKYCNKPISCMMNRQLAEQLTAGFTNEIFIRQILDYSLQRLKWNIVL